MKKKNIIIMIIGIVLVASGITLLFLSENQSNKNPSESKEKTEDKENVPKEYNSLFDIANEMYENKSYLELPKDYYGSYYMTIGEYRKRKYNLSFIDTECSDDFGVIYFDIEHKDEYEHYPIYIIESCKNIIDGSTTTIKE